MNELRSYMAYEGDPADGAVLVFARNSREAHKLAHPTVADWTGCRFVDVKVRWLKSGCAHLRECDEPHVVEAVPFCKRCEKWWEEPLVDGMCEGCREAEAWANEHGREPLVRRYTTAAHGAE